MNVLGFMASPRKGGNSDVLLERFLEGARSQGAQAEKIYLPGRRCLCRSDEGG